MEEIHLAYRTESFSPFVHTLREIGRAEYDLNIEGTLVRGREDAERDLAGGEIDVILGMHYTPFVSKITGEHMTWLAVAQNRRDYKLVTDPRIQDFNELKGKSIAIAKNFCIGINMQLLLKQMGLEHHVAMVEVEGWQVGPKLDLVQRGEVDAALVDIPEDLEAKRRGLRVHETTPVLDIVAGECITTVGKFTTSEKASALRALIQSYLHSISVFVTKPDYIKEMIRNNSRIRNELGHMFNIGDEALLNHFISHWSSRWERKPYANLKALANTHEKATRYDARCAAVNPLTVVDTHYVKEFDENGFIDRLYKR